MIKRTQKTDVVGRHKIPVTEFTGASEEDSMEHVARDLINKEGKMKSENHAKNLEKLITECSNPHSITSPEYWGFEEGLADAMMVIIKYFKVKRGDLK